MAVYWFRRCVTLHPDGRIYGYRGLISHTHMNGYKRTKELPCGVGKENAGWAGAFNMLLARYPDLKMLLDRHIFKLSPRQHIYESRVHLKSLHKRLLAKCRELGIASDQVYPFNTDTMGHRALSLYIKRQMVSRAANAVEANYGKQALKTLQVGDGTNKPVLKPFERVEADAHKIDGIWTVQIPSIFGDVITRTVDRVWDIVLREPKTDVVLAHHLSYNKEITSQDFLQAVHKAFVPWKPKPSRIPTLKYVENAGYPSGLDSRFKGATFSTLSVDGALAETCNRVKSKLKPLGCKTFTIHRRNPNDREIEGYFAVMEENGFHRLPNTTGTGPKDPRRDEPERHAQRYNMQLEDLNELLDLMHANHNATPSTGIGGRTPLGYLRHLCEATHEWPELASADAIERLLITRATVTVRGSLVHGRRPHINFEGVKYTSPILRDQFNILGKMLSIEIPIDIRTVRAFAESGAEIGPLTAASPWNRTPHTLEMRRAILKAQREGRMRHYIKNNDPILDYLDYLEDAARNGKSIPPHYLQVREFLARSIVVPEPSFGDNPVIPFVPTRELGSQSVCSSGVSSTSSDRMMQLRLSRKAING